MPLPVARAVPPAVWVLAEDAIHAEIKGDRKLPPMMRMQQGSDAPIVREHKHEYEYNYTKEHRRAIYEVLLQAGVVRVIVDMIHGMLPLSSHALWYHTIGDLRIAFHRLPLFMAGDSGLSPSQTHRMMCFPFIGLSYPIFRGFQFDVQMDLWLPARLWSPPPDPREAIYGPKGPDPRDVSLQRQMLKHCANCADIDPRHPEQKHKQKTAAQNECDVATFVTRIHQLLKQWSGTMYHRATRNFREQEQLSNYVLDTVGRWKRVFHRVSHEYLIVLDEGESIPASFTVPQCQCGSCESVVQVNPEPPVKCLEGKNNVSPCTCATCYDAKVLLAAQNTEIQTLRRISHTSSGLVIRLDVLSPLH
jgi:hypothetical protein